MGKVQLRYQILYFNLDAPPTAPALPGINYYTQPFQAEFSVRGGRTIEVGSGFFPRTGYGGYARPVRNWSAEGSRDR